jgi:hypothetical protein
VFYRLTPSSKQKVTWFVLFALLFVQVKVAVGGCLVSDYLPPLQTGGTGDANEERRGSLRRAGFARQTVMHEALRAEFEYTENHL